MTRTSQKKEEWAVADRYTRLRGIVGTVEASERPDFLVTTPAGTLGIEVTAYHANLGSDGGSAGREVESAWEALLEFAAVYREQFPEINRLNCWLNFRSHRLPSRSQFEPFCAAVVALLQRNRSRATRAYLDIPVNAEADGILARYVSKVTIREAKAWLDWYWPAHSGGGVGTSDHELMAVLGKKLGSYRPPSGLIESHLVIYGGGPGLSRIAAPFSTEQLEGFPMVNEALAAGPFSDVAILDLRDFLWTRAKGWSKLG